MSHALAWMNHNYRVHPSRLLTVFVAEDLPMQNAMPVGMPRISACSHVHAGFGLAGRTPTVIFPD